MTKLDISDLEDGYGATNVVEKIRSNNTALQLVYLLKSLNGTILQINKPKTDIEKRNYNNLKTIETNLFDAICDNVNIGVEVSDETIQNVINKW